MSVQTYPTQTEQDKQSFLAVVARLPVLMRNLIFSQAMADNISGLQSRYNLEATTSRSVVMLVGEVIVKHVTPNQIVNAVQRYIVSDTPTARKFTIDFLGMICLPMQWYIGNVEGLIQELGGNLEQYITEAKKNYPEVYAPDAQTSATAEKVVIEVAPSKTETSFAEEPIIVRDIEEKLGSSKGRAGVLLHLVRLSQQIEEAGKSGKLSEKETGELLHGLDALSYAVNTQDLNPLEIAAIKRRLKNIVAKVGQ